MLKKNVLLVLGAGGHGKSVAEAALLSGKWEKVVFADDSWPQRTDIAGFSIITNIDKIHHVLSDISAAIPAVGNNQLRQKWFHLLEDLSIPIATVVHPSAIVSSSAEIGDGVTIMAGCVVGFDVKIKDGAIINMASSIDHDTYIGEFAHLSVGVKVVGEKKIGSLTFLPAGSVITHLM
ncbi:acetyltransferase [Acinetobacter baumannii]|uniref:acetyltransferase n=1 Tax=Acinetobacter baumannii TaxID=470 RepID=UPI0029411D06|nr:acetyltransferase [Acinetobacter baumannii]MDV4228673.1 acetyltransferase [Acinetobacter baumannii]